jgi:hypothetical protein
MFLSSIYPLGYKVAHYQQARRLVLASAQAAGPMWEFRWGTTAGHICLVKRVLVTGIQNAAATAEDLRFSLKVARTFTSVDNTNVASILRTADNQKVNGDYADSVLTAFVESNSATAASGGVYTQDTDPICNGQYYTVAGAAPTVDGSDDVIIDFDPLSRLDIPLRLEKDEGFILNLDAAKGATTGFALNLEVAWAECLKVP